MLFLTSPAKTLDLEGAHVNVPGSMPLFLNKTAAIHAKLHEFSLKKLQSTLRVSEDLALLNFNRFKQWQKNHSLHNSRPSIFTFNGDVFTSMNIHEYTSKQLEYCNKHLLILSGFYGALRPFDLMQPYRLEMGTKLSIDTCKNLPAYWQPDLTKYINTTLQDHSEPFVLNLASKEYSAAVNFKELHYPTITVTFLQKRHGEVKTFGILAKKARGMMIDHCITTNAQTMKDIQTFNYDGYKCIEVTDTEITFLLE